MTVAMTNDEEPSMTTQAPPAGWYPDPAGTAARRWWDGQTWAATVEPAMAPAAYAPMAQSVPTRTGAPAGNRLALITFAVVALYIVIAVETRFVIFGFLPLALSLRSKRQGEPLAPFAIAAAGVSIALAALLLFGR
jgi:Protein of unknown function (DUF2510)